MKKTRLYTLTLVGISFIVLLISLVSSGYLYSLSKEKLWNVKLESGEREAREISHLLEQQLRSGLSKTQVIHNLQLSIENTDIKSDFICMYNRNGIELCHPNPALIGQRIQEDNSELKALKNKKTKALSAVLQEGEKANGMRTFPDNKKKPSEILNIYPVSGTDWMVASHTNLAVLQEQLSGLYLQFILNLLLSTLTISICCYAIVRIIYRKHEAEIEVEKTKLNSRVNELQALNTHLNASQEKLQNLPVNTISKDCESVKKRILTYHKDELVKLNTDDIAYVFLDNGITCIYIFDNRQFNSSNSLDEIMKWLDPACFYRANRQFIINIRAITTILLYGKNQLKLIIKPEVNMDVIISKNKAAEFKQWLDQ
jgi:hypothetical protein